MGKTQSGAVWLDPNKTSPFDFYQYWRNVDDADVIKCMRLLTFLPLEQIDEMATWEGSQLNKAKEILAYELTNLVHGEEEAKKAQEGARALFSGGADTAHMPTTERVGTRPALISMVVFPLMVRRSQTSNTRFPKIPLQVMELSSSEAKRNLTEFMPNNKYLYTFF